MRVLIAAMGKTGSTALAYLVHRNLAGHRLVFEPRSLKAVPPDPDLVCKYFLRREDVSHPRLATYDRIVLLVRHPFDTLVSSAMYAPFFGAGFVDDGNLNDYLDLVERKTRQPGAVSFREIMDCCDRRIGDAPKFVLEHETLTRFAQAQRERPFILKYEDMIDRKLDALSDYLGVALDAVLDVPDQLSRVNRTGAYGDWVNWFDPADVEFFAGMEPVRDYLASFAYGRALDPARNRAIDRAHGAGYIVRVANESRARWRLPEFRPGVTAFRDPGSHLGNAIQAYRNRNDAKALNELDAAEAAGASPPGLHYVRGRVHHRRKQFDRAVEEFEKVLEAIPEDHEVLLLLSGALLALGRPGEALDAANRAIALKPSEEQGRLAASRATAALGKAGTSRGSARRA